MTKLIVFSKYKKRLSVVVGLVLFCSAILYLSFSRMNSNRKDFTTSNVSIGNVYTTEEANGEIISENEVLIICPHESIVQNVHRLPGNKVSKGEIILTLDPSSLQADLDAIKDQLGILQINLNQNILSARTTKIDLEHELEVKKLKIASLKAELEDQKDLIDIGGISQARIDKTKQELVIAEKDLLRSSEKHKIKLKQLRIEEDGIRLKISMKEKQIDAKEELIRNMIVKSPGTGIVLEVRARKGENKKKNELLVRISEHTKLKINSEINERQSETIRNGGLVFAYVNGARIEGVIGNIRPELEDDKIKFDVFLTNPHNEHLKINQKIKLHIIKEKREQVLRVEKGEYFIHARSYCNVLQVPKVIPRDITTGLIGNDYIEITHGLDSGEVVINSNLGRRLGSKLEIEENE